MLISTDVEKAFNEMEHVFMIKSLKKITHTMEGS